MLENEEVTADNLDETPEMAGDWKGDFAELGTESGNAVEGGDSAKPPEAAKTGEPETPPPGTTETQETEKLPVGWKADEIEQFKQLPKDTQAAVLRMEGERASLLGKQSAQIGGYKTLAEQDPDGQFLKFADFVNQNQEIVPFLSALVGGYSAAQRAGQPFDPGSVFQPASAAKDQAAQDIAYLEEMLKLPDDQFTDKTGQDPNAGKILFRSNLAVLKATRDAQLQAEQAREYDIQQQQWNDEFDASVTLFASQANLNLEEQGPDFHQKILEAAEKVKAGLDPAVAAKLPVAALIAVGFLQVSAKQTAAGARKDGEKAALERVRSNRRKPVDSTGASTKPPHRETDDLDDYLADKKPKTLAG